MRNDQPGNSRGRIARIVVRAVVAAVLLAGLNAGFAAWWLWAAYDQLAAVIEGSAEAPRVAEMDLTVGSRTSKESEPTPQGHLLVQRTDPGYRLFISHRDHAGTIHAGEETTLWYARNEAYFESDATSLPHARGRVAAALRELPGVGTAKVRLAAALYLRPFVTGWQRVGGVTCLKISIRGGHLVVGTDRWPRAFSVNHHVKGRQWTASLQTRSSLSDLPVEGPGDRLAINVPALEMDRSLAAIVDLLALRAHPVRVDEDGIHREGNGVLVVENGRRLLQLKGSPRQIGYQHGRLLGPSVKRLVEHVVFGVGFVYSMEKGSWFIADARQLVERQRPHIDPDFFEEMRGLAEGAELPMEWIQIANIFPEFFHCSGTALFGEATRDGRLLHARVLDYMTEVGLQDEAVVTAVEKDGARRWVNVGYSGFIGSVTGMNENRVAIGEMGGRGEGDWDGTPMSFLVRGALERCDTLDEVLAYFRDHPRTCEYYYVVSDGNSRTAVGLKATPDILEVVRPGTAHPQLPEPVADAVLMSAGDRYTHLVKRVRSRYGEIDAAALIELIDRPVAMRSNLHNAVFSPEERMLWVANAGRHTPACSEPYARYQWDDLFR